LILISQIIISLDINELIFFLISLFLYFIWVFQTLLRFYQKKETAKYDSKVKIQRNIIIITIYIIILSLGYIIIFYFSFSFLIQQNNFLLFNLYWILFNAACEFLFFEIYSAFFREGISKLVEKSNIEEYKKLIKYLNYLFISLVIFNFLYFFYIIFYLILYLPYSLIKFPIALIILYLIILTPTLFIIDVIGIQIPKFNELENSKINTIKKILIKTSLMYYIGIFFVIFMVLTCFTFFIYQLLTQYIIFPFYQEISTIISLIIIFSIFIIVVVFKIYKNLKMIEKIREIDNSLKNG
jgi:hypothetical protein